MRWPIALLVVVACGSEKRPVTPTAPTTADAPDAGDAAAVPAIDPTRPDVTARPPHGAPHFGMVIATALSRGGTAALSRDAQGELRVWPTLDGKVAPRAVPIRDVTTMRVQDAGDTILVGLAVTSGAGHLVRFDRRGERQGVAEVTGPGTVLQVTPLGDASGAIVLFADHSLALVAPDGTVQSTLARRAARLRAIEAVGADGAVALLRISEGDGEVAHVVVRLETTGGKLAFGPEGALPLAPLEPTRFAISPDGKRVAYTRDLDDKKARVEAERRADRKGPPAAERRAPGVPRPPPPREPPMVRAAKIAVVDAATGADVTPAELALVAYNDVTSLGFTSATRLHVFDASNQAEVELTSGVVIAGSLVRAGAPSIAEGLLLGGFDVSLVMQVPGGATRYLGWGSNVPQRGTLSPDGAHAAWTSMRGELMIEALDGSKEVYGGLFDAPITMLSFVGDEHVLVGSGRGSVHLVEVATGKELGSMMPPGPLHAADVDPGSGWLAGLRPGGGVWLVRIVPGEPMPSTALAVADGAIQFTLLHEAGDGAMLMTSDAKHVVRRYAEVELVAGVSAKQIRERPTVQLSRVMARFDRRGHGYAFEGRKLVVHDLSHGATIPIAIDPIDLLVSDDGAAILLLDRFNTITRVGRDGKAIWTAALGPAGRWAWAFSTDGKRVAITGGAGGQVLDVATGERVLASCAWRFGLTSAPPLSRVGSAPPVCQ